MCVVTSRISACVSSTESAAIQYQDYSVRPPSVSQVLPLHWIKLQMNEQGKGEFQGIRTEIPKLEVEVSMEKQLSYEPGDLTRDTLLSYKRKDS